MKVKDKLDLMKKMEADNAARVEALRMDNRLFGVKIDVVTGKAYQYACPNSLEGLRNVIACDWIETAVREIGGKPFMVICDEEGRLNRKAISGIIPFGDMFEVAFVGNLFIVSAKVDKDGDMVSLTSDEAEFILKNGIRRIVGNRQIIQCNYPKIQNG